MNNLEIRKFANQVGLLLPDTAKRRIVLPALIGMAIGNFLQVKQGDSVNPITTFNDLHVSNVSRAVSFLNEEIMLDVNAAIEAAKSMYLVRHRIFNGQPASYSVNPEFDIMSVALGLSVVLPVEVYQAMKETGLSAATAYGMANILIADLKKSTFLSL